MPDNDKADQSPGSSEQNNSMANYEYNTLMSLLEVSVSKHLLDEHFTVVWANDFYYQIIGWSKEEYETLFHNQCDRYYQYYGDMTEWNRIVATVVKTLNNNQNSYSLATPLRRKDGNIVWVRINAALSDEYIDGKRVSYTAMTNIDDLVRIRTEQTVTYESLPGFVAKYRIEKDFQFTLLDANTRFIKAFGRSRNEPSALFTENLKRNSEVLEAHKEQLMAGKAAYFVFHINDIDGNSLWLQVNAACIDWQDGCPVYLVIFIDITDVTELREMKQRLTEQKEELENALEVAERANHAKSDFLSRMSHDIRTPMNAVMGMTAIAADHLDDPDRVMDCLEKIQISSKLLLSLINEVLDMSKIESGRIVLAEEEVNLAELVHGVATMVQPQIGKKSLEFNVYIHDIRHERVVSDMQRLQQLLLNLLSNAVKYTPEGGRIILEINEHPAEAADMAVYEFMVSDTGIGMKPEFLSRVFEPFERADDDIIRMVQGTGLGLAICKSVSELMGGTIEVQSEYGKGSRFVVTVCLKVLDEAIDESALCGRLILVVDDDETVCDSICKRLCDLGVKAISAPSGSAAVEKVVEAKETGQDIFAVIIDYKMPGMDGIETTRRIREKVGKGLPIIMISAYDLSDHVDAALRAGANGFITKPLFRSSLVYKLGQFLENYKKETPINKAKTQNTFAGERILLVEDNALNREIAVVLLTKTGAAVDTAENGKLAVEKMVDSPIGYYNLILMDMQMPVMDGCTATRAIRALPRADAETIPIIAMTANAFADDRKQTQDAGMNEHLAKPIDIEQLHHVLQKWLS